MSVPYAEVIGDPIEHSLSPIIHCYWLKRLGIRSGYRRHRVGRAQLAGYLQERRTDSAWRGCNVTMPLKLDALTLADEASDRALGAGATNILVPRDGKLLAGNTDIAAVVLLLERLAAAGAAMDSVTLLGTGGAARAALVALRQLGLTAVCIQARDVQEAYKLAVEFRLAIEPRPFDRPIETDGLINATPLGMTGMLPLDVDIDAMPNGGWVYDFVTSPRRTDLLDRAAARGLRTVDGIAMLVEQAADAFRLFFGADAPREHDSELFARLAE